MSGDRDIAPDIESPVPTGARLRLDHLVVVAPTLSEGVAHVRDCIDIDVPFGQRHGYMGTHNHLLQLGDAVYLEIVALDPDGRPPRHGRWFGLDQQDRVRADWDAGRRLRTWVASTDAIDLVLARRGDILGQKVLLPWTEPSFEFALLEDGSMPLEGAAPSVIDRRGKKRSMAAIADHGARLRSFSLEHPRADVIADLHAEMKIDRAPTVTKGCELRYRARIATPRGPRELS